jgi:hypothetical protein
MDVMRWTMVVGLTLASLFFVVAVGIAGWLYYAKKAAKRMTNGDTEAQGSSLLQDRKSIEE